jgi:DNA-binding NarL/FixJ family response regulator
LVEDQHLIRTALRMMLEAEPGLEVAGEAGDGRQAVELARALRPGVVVMDVSMPRLNGMEAARQMVKERPDTRILALSMYREPRLVRGMLEAGCRGYLLKDCCREELLLAVRSVARGQSYLSPEVAGMVVEGYLERTGPEPGGPPAAVPTGREREILQLLAEGHSVGAVSQSLHISPKTVETHRRNLMEKLGLHSRLELIKYGLRVGLADPDAWFQPGEP